MVKTIFFDSKKTTLSRLEAPHITPIVKGPSSRKLSSKKHEHFIWDVMYPCQTWDMSETLFHLCPTRVPFFKI